MLPGERHRERFLTFEQEARYLAVGFGLLVRIQRSNTVVATRRLESVFPHTDDKGLQFVIRRLWIVEPGERFSIPLDCAGADVADELTLFDELLKLFNHYALQGRGSLERPNFVSD